MPVPERVSERLEQRGECLVWTGGRNNKGYGSIGLGNKRTALVHRFVYEEVVGPIPEDMTIDHLCRNKVCVNVEHLEVVTRSENSRRAARDKARDQAAANQMTPEQLAFRRAETEACLARLRAPSKYDA